MKPIDISNLDEPFQTLSLNGCKHYVVLEMYPTPEAYIAALRMIADKTEKELKERE